MSALKMPVRDHVDALPARPMETERLSVSTSTVDRVLAATHPPGRFRLWPWVGPVVIALIGLVLLLQGRVLTGSPVSAPMVSPAAEAALSAGGTVVAAQTNGGDLVVRDSHGDLVHLGLAGGNLITGGGQPLSGTSVRAGDAIIVRAGNVVVDTSQVQISVQGVVASAPDPQSNVMTVQLSPRAPSSSIRRPDPDLRRKLERSRARLDPRRRSGPDQRHSEPDVWRDDRDTVY